MNLLTFIDQIYTVSDSFLLLLVIGGAAGLSTCKLSGWLYAKLAKRIYASKNKGV